MRKIFFSHTHFFGIRTHTYTVARGYVTHASTHIRSNAAVVTCFFPLPLLPLLSPSMIIFFRTFRWGRSVKHRIVLRWSRFNTVEHGAGGGRLPFTTHCYARFILQ